MKGVPPHFESAADGVEYELPCHAHLPSAYFGHLRGLGMEVVSMQEPRVDDALVVRVPAMAKHRGSPLGLLLEARKKR